VIVSAAVFTAADAHRRCKATRGDELLTQAWIEFATRVWERHHDKVRAIRAASARITGRVQRQRRESRVVKITQDMGRTRVRFGVVLLGLLVAGAALAADPVSPEIVCEAIAPFRALVAAEVWWAHRNPTNPAEFWGWYIAPQVVESGFRVALQPEGHPVAATIAFTEMGIGGRYAEVRCGVVPWAIFADGFESGGTGAWTMTAGAVEKGAGR